MAEEEKRATTTDNTPTKMPYEEPTVDFVPAEVLDYLQKYISCPYLDI